MKIIEKRIENWCKDARFVNFANRRMHQEITERLENGSYDALFEELDEAFDYDDRYIEPLVEYLTCRLHIAKLNKKQTETRTGHLVGMVPSGHGGVLCASVFRILFPAAERTANYSDAYVA